MSFGASGLTLALLLRIDLPGHNVRLSEGGEFRYGGDIYRPSDDVLGNITAFEDHTTGEADQAPLFEVTWGVKDIAAAVSLSSLTAQGSFADWRIVGLETATGAQVSEQRIFTGFVDRTEISGDVGRFELTMGFATDIDRLLNTDKGNRLNAAFHRSVWPNEGGLDMMTGTTIPVPWGDKSTVSGVRVAGGGGGSRGSNPSNQQIR